MLVVLPYSLTAHTTAEASKVMANYNKILEALNGNIDRENLKDGEVITAKLADAAVTSQKLKPIAGEVVQSEAMAEPGAILTKDIPGCVKVVNPAVKSLLIVTATFQAFAAGEGKRGSGKIVVDGVQKGALANFERLPGGTDTVTVTTAITLEPGEHTVKLQFHGELTPTFTPELLTRFSYLMVAA